MFVEAATVSDEPSAQPEHEERRVRIRMRDPVAQGALDVVSLAALVRAVRSIVRNKEAVTQFDRSLSKMIALNNSMAKVIENDQR